MSCWSDTAMAMLALIGAWILKPVPATSPAKPVRFQIPLPEKVDLSSGPGAHSRLAGCAVVRFGESPRRIQPVRPLDRLAVAGPLDGTERDAAIPFWSPDSRFSRLPPRKLQEIAVWEERARRLYATAPDLVSSGSWNRNGVIIFGGIDGRLVKVPAVRGTAEAVDAHRLRSARCPAPSFGSIISPR